MQTADILIDGFERIRQIVHSTVEGLTTDQLAFRPSKDANSICWLIWHLTRIQDDHIAGAAQNEQIWHTDGWQAKFKLPFTANATGWGQTSEEVAQVRADTDLLLSYYDAVHAASIDYLQTLQPEDYDRIVDENWDPPVTLAVRLISIISDDLQHAGQAAYVKGLIR